MSNLLNARLTQRGFALTWRYALMSTHNFNAQEELADVREFKKTARRKTYIRSRLNKYRAELIALKKANASYSEIVLWLRQKKHIKVNHTTVLRFLNKQPEFTKAKEKQHAELPQSQSTSPTCGETKS